MTSDTGAPVANPGLYTTGGTVQASDGLYLTRSADDQLLQLCRAATFAYVLSPRQMGKSSLIERCAQRLGDHDVRSVIVDLSLLGVNVSPEAWYLGMLTIIGDQLHLDIDAVEWWQAHASLGFSQRLTQFLQEVVLQEISQQVVVFIDEIDTTLSLTSRENGADGRRFSDDFFIAIRGLHNARAHAAELKRLSFVLIGVATPGDLIHDAARTPFNIGTRVELTDFDFDEAQPLAVGLGPPSIDQAEQVLRWVLYWTGGHPYLTQKLCRALASEQRTSWTEAQVEEVVNRLFLADGSEQDNTNLEFVRDMLTKRAPDAAAVLATYRDVLVGFTPVRDEEQSLVISHLKLSGVVRVERAVLRVRNLIYERVFDVDWIRQSSPLFAIDGGYIVGGTVHAGLGALVSRRVDNDLLALCRAGVFTYILGPRQTGKSSLLGRTAEQLAAEGIRSALVDLTAIGIDVTAESWYLATITAITNALNLSTNTLEWWSARPDIAPAQRLQHFLQDVVLGEIDAPVVIFFDEIDVTLRLPFAGDFYATLEALQASRRRVPALQRLTFVISGLATTHDLLAAGAGSLLDLGQPVELTDFTFEEARPLAAGLGVSSREQAEQVLRWVLSWTGGHPFLTLRLCRAIASAERTTWTEAAVDELVASVFLAGRGGRDTNLSFVADRLTRGPESVAVLALYRRVLRDRLPIRDDAQSRVKAYLKASGVVRGERGVLRVRNRVYERVFTDQWLSEYIPVNWQKVLARAALAAVGVLVFLSVPLAIIALHLWEQTNVALEQAKTSLAEANVAQLQSFQDAQQAVNAAAAAQASSAEAVAQRTIAEQQRLLAEQQRTVADQQTGVALARQLAAQAEVLRTQRGDLLPQSVLLAVEATKRLPSIESEHALRLALALLAPTAYELNHGAPVWSVAYSGDGRYAASGGDDGAARLWDAATGQQIKHIDFGQPVVALAVNFDASQVAPVLQDGSVAVVDVATGTTSQSIRHPGALSVAFRGDGTRLATGGRDSFARVWDVTSGDQVFEAPLADNINGVTFSADGQLLGVASSDKTASVWDITTGGRIAEMHHDDGVQAVAFSPSGDFLASVSWDKTARLWTVPDGREIRRLTHEASVRGVAFDPGGRYVATGSEDRTLRLWEVSSGREIKRLPYHDFVQGVAYSPDGQLLAAASLDGAARAWRVGPSANPDEIRLLHDGVVSGVSFSPDASLLATSSWDHQVRIWDTAAGTEVAPGTRRRGRKCSVQSRR